MHPTLALLHIADSAVPIGAAAHSFGLESLVEEGFLTPASVEGFLRDVLSESGVLEAMFVRRAWSGEDLRYLSAEFGARRLARESREAAFKMGQRFSRLLNAMLGTPAVPDGVAYPVAFGYAGAHLGLAEEDVVVAYLRQSLAGLISACQRLMPLGQVAANCIVWNLGRDIESAAVASQNREANCFTPLPELASMRHGSLETRLFIS